MPPNAILVAALLSLAAPHAPPDTAAPAPMFRGDAARTGHYETRAVARLGGLRWRFETGGPVRSTPAVAGDVVYVGSGDGHLYALDRACGREVWRFDAGSSVSSSPAVADGRVYFGGRDGRFFAVDAATGREVWRVATGEAVPWAWGHESADIFTSSPAAWRDRVLFGAGDGHLYAVDAGTGDVLWKTFLHGRVRSSPAIHDGTAVVGSADGSVYVVALDDGRILRRFDTEGRTLDSGDFGFDRKTVQSTPAVADGRVFVGAKDGHLYAFDHDDAGAAWRSDHKVSWVLGGPAAAGGVVYAGTSDGRFVQAVDAGSGRELWRSDTPSSVWTSPAVAGDVVYVGDNAGYLRALDRETGEELWNFGTGGRMQSSPVPDDGMVFVGSDDGGVYALGEGPPVRRAVFWDSTLVDASWYRGHRELRDYMAARGYRVVDAGALAAFLRERIDGGAPSVVVFAIDALPPALRDGGREALLRRYLDAGGKVVWVGVPPLLWPRDPETGSPGDLTDVDRGATRALLGVDHGRGNFDVYGAFPTAAGRRWGLADDWWMARWSATPGPDLVPLAVNEHGLASAWVRGYGGSPGTGFVRIWGDYEPIPDLRTVHTVAEYRAGAACTEGRPEAPRDPNAAASPAARAHHQLVHHGAEGRTYLVGGSTPRRDGHHYFDEVRSWDGEAWTPEPPLPFPRSSHRVVYHEGRGSLVLFGGGFGRAVRSEGVFWERADGAWKPMGGDHRLGRSEHGMCYDRRRRRIAIFGGWAGPGDYRGETLEWTGEELAVADTAGPGARAGHAFLWDPVRRRCLLFGGRGPDGLLDDTWEWDGEAWRHLDVRGPSPRWFFGSATDPESGRVVVFGGAGSDGDLGDTWAWDGAGWERIAASGPPPRSMAKLAFTGSGVLLFGGRRAVPDGYRDLDDTWELVGSSWVRR